MVINTPTPLSHFSHHIEKHQTLILSSFYQQSYIAMDKSPFSIAPVSTLQKNELFFHLYLHQNYTGSSSSNTQSIIVKPGLPNSFGNTVVNDWALYDGQGPNAKVVARARGLHINSGMSSDHWQNYFSIVFEDDR